MNLSGEEYYRAVKLLYEYCAMLEGPNHRVKKINVYLKRYSQDVMTFSKESLHELGLWEAMKLRQWKGLGRLTYDGTLRLEVNPTTQ